MPASQPGNVDMYEYSMLACFVCKQWEHWQYQLAQNVGSSLAILLLFRLFRAGKSCLGVVYTHAIHIQRHIYLRLLLAVQALTIGGAGYAVLFPDQYVQDLLPNNVEYIEGEFGNTSTGASTVGSLGNCKYHPRWQSPMFAIP